jgi:myosin heavy subunit
LPRCNDDTFARAIFAKCEGNAYFEATQMQKSKVILTICTALLAHHVVVLTLSLVLKGTFVISHFAGQVEYETEGFLLKNKDELPKSACELLAASNVPLISALSSIVGAPEVYSGGPSGSLTRSNSSVAQSSVSSQFVSQLKDLRSRISQTGPHYIRCLKPNDSLVPDHFEESLIAHQLNCAGVLPAMKLARAGYSMRYPHSSFILRFRCIASKELPPEPKTRFGRPKLTSDKLLSVLSKKLELQIKKRGESTLDGFPDIVSWGVQIGKTKVFLREVAFNALEELRLSTINVAAGRLQSRTRVFLCRSRFLLILGSVITLQCATRKLLARLRVFRLRCTSRAVVIQKNWRSYSAWVYFQNSLFVAITCQRFWRGGKVRESFSSIKEYRAAISLQSFWRSYIQSVVHRQVRDAAIIVQCAFRVYVAKRTARQLRREANDVSLIIRERDQLRLEMKQMRVELEGIRRNGSSICPSHETMSRTSGMDPSVYSQSHEIKMLHQECAKKDRELRELRKQVDSLCGNKSTPSTLPTTVTISRIESPSFSSLRHTHVHSSSNLLDSEMADLDDLECSAISTNEESLDNIQLPSLHLSSDSHPVESGMHELPLHYAVEHNNKTMFLLELERSCDVDVEINSTDSVGRCVLDTFI